MGGHKKLNVHKALSIPVQLGEKYDVSCVHAIPAH